MFNAPPAPASLSFQANPAYVRELERLRDGSTRLGLSFPVASQHFVAENRNPRVRLKCSASIDNFYWESAEITLLQERPKFASVMKNGEGVAAAAAAGGATPQLMMPVGETNGGGGAENAGE